MSVLDSSAVLFGLPIAASADVGRSSCGIAGLSPITKRHDGALMPDERYEGPGSIQSGGIEGRYANYFRVGHNAFEFLLDFGQLYSDGKVETYHTRIITNPPCAKELLKVLGEAVERYEQAFGSIKQQ